MSAPPAILVLRASGLPIGRRLQTALPDAAFRGPSAADDFATELRARFAAGEPVVAVCAAGIVIRLLAPHLEDKSTEPPVVVVAEDGSVTVPLLGGHRGANRLACAIAKALGGVAAITTAGDLQLGLALDEPPPGWRVRNPGVAKRITAALLDGRPVALRIETGRADWLTAGNARFADDAELQILVTDRDAPGSAACLVVHPEVLALGVGCERGVGADELIGLVETALAEHQLPRTALACVVSIDLKAAEPAVHALAEHLGRPARFLPAEVLEAETPRLANPSPPVFEATGCHGVAEGAALAAVGPAGTLIVPKTKSARATCALARAPAPLDPARIGRPQGELAIIGVGPGQASWRTPEASALLNRAEDWVGYHGYLDLLGEPRAGCACHPFALGEEEARVRHALDLAAAGRRVALISSGDPGIYAMAALVFELLERDRRPGWQRVAVTVSPGISALQAAAARAGAPLGHDFCVISLSDLLTPWPEIERRLVAAAGGDFVTALYNPASERRRQGLARALAIFAARRPPETPLLHARNLGRHGEHVEVHRLHDFAPDAVDMLSLLIVGSSRTRLVPRWHGRPFVYTPRGYVLAEGSAG